MFHRRIQAVVSSILELTSIQQRKTRSLDRAGKERMANSGDPNKRPPPLTLEHEFATAVNSEAGYRRHKRSATLMSPVTGQVAWEMPADPREPTRHRKRLSEGVNKLLKSASSSPRKLGHSAEYDNAVENTKRNVRGEKETTDTTIPSILGMVEQRHEARAGKIPASGNVHDPVVIERVDLREQCRESARERNPEKESGLKSLSTSTKNLLASAANTTRKVFKKEHAPPMSTKAAETMGYTPRAYRKYEAIPIKPSGLPKLPSDRSPSRNSQSSKAPLLPSKVAGGDTIFRSHHDGVGLRDRSRHSSSSSLVTRGSKKSFNEPNTDVKSKGKALVSPRPPTPPAKDTPPKHKYADDANSPLRHMSQSRDLRVSFGSTRLVFNQPFKFPRRSGIAQPAQQPADEEEAVEPQGVFSVDDMTALIFSQPHPEDDEQGHDRNKSSKQATAATNKRFSLDSLPFLQPRFYSPAGHSVRSFAPGESPSTNTDPVRMLFRHMSRRTPPNPSQQSSDSKEGSIGVMFQGNAEDIDRGSSTFQTLSERDKRPAAARDDTTITTRVMQELRLSDNDHPDTAATSQSAFDKPPSRLTEMLHETDSRMHGWDRNFAPNCPSAVPSPLHHMPVPATPRTSTLASPKVGTLNINTPRSLDEHFWMTNEHLDVVGKTTWDILEMSNRETLAAINTKNAKLVAHIEKHFEDLKSHLTTVDDKADRSAEKVANVHQEVEKLLSVYDNEIASAFAAQEKKTAHMEGQLKDLQSSMQAVQKLLEQMDDDSKSGQQQPGNNSHPPLNTVHSPYTQQMHRSQPSLGSYYGHLTNTSRDGQPPMAQVSDNMNAVSPRDANGAAQTGPDTGHGNQWGSRYPVRGSSKEARTPYSGTNPYMYTTGGPYSGGYPGGYSHTFPCSPAEPHFGPGQAK
ncbi:hypothetical protein NX059_000266 [Plenodomus lindquistii]|nr:hypothetical protein NX059_000266 [Plenodomus lindquistii]